MIRDINESSYHPDILYRVVMVLQGFNAIRLQVMASTRDARHVRDSFVAGPEMATDDRADQARCTVHTNDERILLIDGSPGVVDVVSELLGVLGYTITGIFDAGSALQHFREYAEDYALVMTDFRMPVMSGVELAEVIHRLSSDTPVILLSGFDDGVISSANVVDIVQKPASVGTLKRVIEHVFVPAQLAT